MQPSLLEDRILKLALDRGLLAQEDLQSIRSRDSEDRTEGSPLVELLQAGRLDEDSVQMLALEVMNSVNQEDSSWQPEEEETATLPGMPLAWKGYTELSPLGEGGGGAVYRAWDPQLSRWVALKFLHRDHPDRVSRLLVEARALAKVDHPNVVKVHEVGEHEGRLFIAMQYVQGGTLVELSSTLTLEQKVKLTLQVAEALHAAHQQGLVHLDVKPANILVESSSGEPHPYITDFGLVRDASEDRGRGIPKGTVPYASPEQLLGDVDLVDRRSDVYSLGATFHFLLTGYAPFDSKDPAVLMEAEPLPMDRAGVHVPEELQSVRNRCLQKDPADRYANASDLAEDLRNYLEGRPVAAHPQTLGYRAGKWLRGRRPQIIQGLMAGLVFLLLVWVWIVVRRSATQTRLALRYGQEVQTVEQALRTTHLSRLHDRRPALRALRQAMDRIRQDMAHLGSVALGPGSYALGEGSYAVGDYTEARRYLDMAWQSNFRTPACAKVRGQVYAELYLAAKGEIGSDDPSQRQKTLEQLAHEFRDPALACFQVVREAGLITPYQEAMECYLKGQLDEALHRIQTTGSQIPWLYETDLLEHRIHNEKMKADVIAEAFENAQSEFEAAGKALDRAVDAAPSDPATWEAKGWWCLEASQLPQLQRERSRWADQSRTNFQTALLVDPEYTGAYNGLAEVCSEQADLARQAGRDPMPFLDQGVAYAETGRAYLSGSRPDPELSWALISRAEQLVNRGQDVRVDLDRAIDVLKQCLANRSDFDVLEGLNSAYFLRATVAGYLAEDPLPYLRESLKYAESTSAVEFGNPRLKGDALNRRMDLMLAELRAGSMPRESLTPIEDQLVSLAKDNPKEHLIALTLAQTYKVEAWILEAQGKDPRESCEASRRAHERALGINPASPDTLLSYAELELREGYWLKRHNGDPLPVWNHGLSIASEFRKADPLNTQPGSLQKAFRCLIAEHQGRRLEAGRILAQLRADASKNAYVAWSLSLLMEDPSFHPTLRKG